MHREQNHFGLEGKTGEPSSILTGFFRIIGGDGLGLTPFEAAHYYRALREIV